MRAIHTKKKSEGFDYSLYYRGGGLKIEIDVHGDIVEDIVENIKGIGFEAELLEIEKVDEKDE